MRWIGWMLLLLAALGATAAGAEEPAAEEPPPAAPVFTPGEIIVTGRQAPAEATASLQEIDENDLRALGATNVAEALQTALGARVDTAPTSLSANGKQEMLASLRGFDPRDVVVLVDGIPVYEPYFRVIDLRQIPVGDIAKIQVFKGPTSVLYGPNALGGVINIVTKRGGGPARGHVDAGYGDVETYRGNAAVRGGAGGLEYFLAPGFDKSRGFPLSGDFGEARNQEPGLRVNSDYRDFYLSGKAGYYRGANGLSLSANHYEFDGGVPFSMEAIEPSTLWRKFWRKTGAALYGELSPAAFLYLRGNAFYTRFYNTITTDTDKTMSAVIDDGRGVSTYDNDVFGYHLLPEFLFGPAGTLTLSLLYKQDRVDIQEENGAKWYEYGAETYSEGGEYGVEFYRFKFTAGVAHHLYRRTQTPETDLGEDNGAVDYQAGLSYAPHEMIDLRAAVAHKSAFPDLKTLYGSEGNPDLKPEAALNVDAGFRFQPLPQLKLASTWFYADVKDLIGKQEMGNDYTVENIDRAKMTGLESELGVNLAKGLFAASLGHTYLDTRDERDSRQLHRLDFRPEHTAYADGRVNLPFGTSLTVQYFYVGERQYEEPSADRAKKALPEYGLVNARLGQTIRWDEGRTAAEFFVQGKNLFDVYYELAPEKAAPGRMLFGGVAMDF